MERVFARDAELWSTGLVESLDTLIPTPESLHLCITYWYMGGEFNPVWWRLLGTSAADV